MGLWSRGEWVVGEENLHYFHEISFDLALIVDEYAWIKI